MRISVISFNGAPPARPLAYDFDSRGGAIGREEGNELTLPDPERHISRVQARIEFDGANFVLVDTLHGVEQRRVDPQQERLAFGHGPY